MGNLFANYVRIIENVSSPIKSLKCFFLNFIYFWYVKMCHKLYHFIWGIWWFHRSKDFEAMKAGKLAIRPKSSPNLNSCSIKISHRGTSHTVQEWLEIKIYCLWLFSTFHIHTWWGQSKYVWKFEISRTNFEKSQNLYILKIFLWILCINMQNGSNSKELRHK